MGDRAVPDRKNGGGSLPQDDSFCVTISIGLT